MSSNHPLCASYEPSLGNAKLRWQSLAGPRRMSPQVPKTALLLRTGRNARGQQIAPPHIYVVVGLGG